MAKQYVVVASGSNVPSNAKRAFWIPKAKGNGDALDRRDNGRRQRNNGLALYKGHP